MSQYDDEIMDSDLDAFKNAGAISAAGITFAGSVGGGGEMNQSVSLVASSPDFMELLFDSSTKHPGRFKSFKLVPYTLINEVTLGSELGVDLTVAISGNNIVINGKLFNPYSGAVTLQTTTINFRYIPYEATI